MTVEKHWLFEMAVCARRLYQKLGFKDRMQMTARVLQPPAAATSR